MREDIYTSRGCPILAGLLPGMQGKGPACGDDHKNMQALRKTVWFFIGASVLAALLPGMSEKPEGH